MPADVTKLRTHLGHDPASTVDSDAMSAACAAANALAVWFAVDGTSNPEDWPDNVDQGAVIEAAYLYGTRGSTQGAAAYADLGVITIAELHPAVRILWGLGEYQKPVVA